MLFRSDHGTEVYEHRRLDHGFTLYDEQLRVPLIVKLPGRTGGKRIADRGSSIDLMPTLLDLLDVDAAGVKDQFRGSSLVPAFSGGSVARPAFSETDYREDTFKRSIVRPDGWKLIATLESKTRELYDLNADPGELNDLSGKEPRRADELEAALYAHFKSIGHDLAARCDECLRAPSDHTPRIQEAHLVAWHLICDLVERGIVAADTP